MRDHKPSIAATVFKLYTTSFPRVHIQININMLVHRYSVVYFLSLHAKLVGAQQILGIPILFCFVFTYLPLFQQCSMLYYTVLGLSENPSSWFLEAQMLLGGAFCFALCWCLGILNSLRVSEVLLSFRRVLDY